MTYFPEPLKPSEGRPEDEIRVNPIEADKKGSEGSEAWKRPEPSKEAKVGGFLLFVKKFATLFSTEKSTAKQKDATLLALKEILEEIKRVDHSTDAPFCQHFSEVWHAFMSHVEEGKVHEEETLLEEMGHYPKDASHQLGHYLYHFAGESWLPVPFQEILKRLHNDPETLARWISSI